jgi:hypothetical protein
MNGEDRDEQHHGEREGRHGHCRFNSCRERGFCWRVLARKRVAGVTVYSDSPTSVSLIEDLEIAEPCSTTRLFDVIHTGIRGQQLCKQCRLMIYLNHFSVGHTLNWHANLFFITQIQ